MVQEVPGRSCVDSEPEQHSHGSLWSFHYQQQWNTYSSQPKQPHYLVFKSIQASTDSSCSLLSSGNLVLIDNVTSTSESYLWKSYDYPINTWLPGMIIGKDMSNGLNQFLTSCKDSDIASPGDSTYKFDYKGLPQIYIFVKVEA